MSFRVRVFVLVMLVAATAIGATGWLALRLASRGVESAVAQQNRHRTDIVAQVQRYGLLHGSWPGVDRLVSRLSDGTDLHIQLQSEDGLVIADSDTLAHRTSRPVQAIAYHVQPVPEPDVDLTEPATRSALLKLYPKMTITSANLFGPAPTGPLHGSPPVLALRQAAQYRAGLALVRCLHGTDGALDSETAPFVTGAQLATSPDCTRRAEAGVLDDQAFFDTFWHSYTTCTDACVWTAFADAISTDAAPALNVFLGSGDDRIEIADFGRPAIAGAAGLLVLALAGTFLIARQVSRPVRKLTAASHLLAEGQLDVRVPITGRSELARLSASFNAMADAVQRSEERQRRLVADVAHELRTPLSNLRGYLEGLSDGVIEPSPELFASLHEETLLQRRILDDLQVLALAEAGDLDYTRTPVDLAELATVSATAHRAVADEAGVALTVDADAPIWVDADQDRLRQVLGNLLTNAIRYTDRDGSIKVSVRAGTGQAILTVEDTGVGITAGDLPHVFDRFWRADPARQRATGGTGLGLTIAHRIVTDHGGRVDVESRPHLGTTFTVTLPSIPNPALDCM